MITANDRYSGNHRYSGIKGPDHFFHYSGRCLYRFPVLLKRIQFKLSVCAFKMYPEIVVTYLVYVSGKTCKIWMCNVVFNLVNAINCFDFSVHIVYHIVSVVCRRQRHTLQR